MSKEITLPPDEPLIALAKAVNAKSGSASINLYRIENEDGSKETGIVFQCGTRRALVRTRNVMTEHDAPDLIKAVDEWVNRSRVANRWSADARDARPLDWRTV
jgi:hypothetical protein